MAEVHHSSLGGTDPSGYLTALATPELRRGEAYLLGRWYAGGVLAMELTPLVTADAATFVNLHDPSALALAGLSLSLSDEGALRLGAVAGLGDRPEGFLPASELGMAPTAAYLELRLYR